MPSLNWLAVRVGGLDELGGADPGVLHALEPDVAVVVVKDLAIECLPLAHFEQ